MAKGEKLADTADHGEEMAAVSFGAKRLGPRRAASEKESRREGTWRLGPIMSPRTSELVAAVIDDIQQIVRDELRTVHAQLQAIADAVRQQATPSTNPDEMMTVDQVAEAVKVIPATVRMWIHSGQLRAIRPGVGRGPGRTFRISRADLNQFLESVQEHVTDSDADARKEAAKIVAIVASKRKT